MFILIFRTIILYSVSMLALRLMGKRQIGELEPFELAIAIMISELASMPMQDTRIPIINGIIPVITLLIVQILVSIGQIKSEKIRILISGKPSILIDNGKINIYELKNQRININDLMEELRLKGYYDIGDIKFAILETSGQLSLMPNSSLNPVTKKDLNLNTPQDKLPITLIIDGKLNHKNLKISSKNMDWLNSQLKNNNISSVSDIFLGVLDSKNNFYFQLKKSGCDKK
ncbi:DUF421 domain-containing protein [Haloimpatiens sp. FM7315]|uniref:DUF421 domain-containing protein n=1 Tax=Haloimpatiens sp. FM7315 TaxID=3298609 RepID=UPI00370C5BE0